MKRGIKGKWRYLTVILSVALLAGGIPWSAQRASAAGMDMRYLTVDGIQYDDERETLIRCPEEKAGMVDIPSGITTIGQAAFRYCGNLTGVSIPKSVVKIEREAFAFCGGLTGIHIPFPKDSSYTLIIGEGAFQGCGNLRYAALPKEFGLEGSEEKYIEPFKGCSQLKAVYFAGSQRDVAEIRCFLPSKGYWEIAPDYYSYSGMDRKKYLLKCVREAFGFSEEVAIYFDVDADVYQYDILCDDTLEITGYAGGEKSVIPAYLDGRQVSAIGSGAFSGKSVISEMLLPEGIRSIGANAFYGCSGLRSINIPMGVAEIGRNALGGCANLEDIYYAGSEGQWESILKGSTVDAEVYYNCEPSEYSCLIQEDGTVFVSGYGGTGADITIPRLLEEREVTGIEAGTFAGRNGLKSVGIPESVGRIGLNAFSGCYGLKEVYYAGNKKQWGQIAIAGGNEYLTQAAIHYKDNSDEPIRYYTVSFNAWGVAEYQDQSVAENTFALAPGEPVRGGYVFLGWFNGEDKWDFEYGRVQSDMVLNAKWENKEKVVVKEVFGKMELVDGEDNVIIARGTERNLDASGLAKYTFKKTNWQVTSGADVIRISSTEGRSITMKAEKEGTGVIEAAVYSEYWMAQPGESKPVFKDSDTTFHNFKYRVVSHVTEIKMDSAQINLSLGSSLPLGYSTTPASNYARSLSGLTFSTSDSGVAVVSEDGIVTATGYGTATIRAYLKNSGLTAEAFCEVVVSEAGSVVPTPVPTERPGTGVPTPVPTEGPGTGVIPPVPTEEPGTGVIPPVPTEEPGTGVIPPVPTEGPGTGVIPPVPTEGPGTGVIPPVPTEKPGPGVTTPENQDGLVLAEDGNWYYYVNQQIAFDYTGLVSNEAGWWYVRNGRIDFEYTGLCYDPVWGWWLISGGTVAFEYTGLWNDPVWGWWLINGGTVAFEYTGLWNDSLLGVWYIQNGCIDFGRSNAA